MRNFQNITDKYFAPYQFTPEQIDSGMCMLWAFLAYLEDQQNIKLVTAETSNKCNHAFIKLGNRFYDAEMPKGTTNLNLLPFFKRWGPAEIWTVFQNPKEFQEYWDSTFFYRVGFNDWPQTK